MALEDWRRERRIRLALCGLTRQRVALMLNPGNVMVVECSPPRSEGLDAAYKTCEMRGWIGVLHDAVPQGGISPDGKVGATAFETSGPVYRITEAGWAVINRAQAWAIATFAVAMASLVASMFSILLTLSTR
ncbi:MAG TPA: hypothetical protein VNT30_14425 [Stellaceae bacterium]|nr:hypothetical protein [Stellaceae bacterium]